MSVISPTSNPYNQSVTILKADGTPITFYLGDLDYTFNYNVKLSINYGAQMGACLAMFFVLAVLTKAKNRSHPLFTLNLLSLLFGFLRTLLLALYGVSDWVKAYPYWTGDWSAIPRSAYTTSIAGVVMSLLMAITINMSLVLQAHAVCKAMDRVHTYVIVGVSCIVLLLTVGFRFAQVVTNCLAIINLETYFAQAWIQIGTLATETTSIWWFSIIFIGKLVWTLYNRKRQGWKQWSAVRVLATMGGCTMIIPSIFAVLEYTSGLAFPEAGTLTITMVALLLPLSSLWARMATDSEASTLNLSSLSGPKSKEHASDSQRKLFGCLSTAQSSGLMSERKPSHAPSYAPISPTTIDAIIENAPSRSPRDSTEVDLEAMGVRVDRSYSVHSGK